MKRWMRLGVAALLLAVGLGSASAQIGNSLAFRRVEHLRRGVNLAIWYAQNRDYSPERMDAFVTKADMQLIKSLGFDHVRLSIDPERLIANVQSGALRPEPMARLDRSVAELLDAGLNVVLDVHPEDPWKVALNAHGDAPLRFFAFWAAFATHYANTDPERVFFEIMNEPTLDDIYRWQGIQARTVATIRRIAPRHTIIATSSTFSKVDTLLALEPVRDENVIYTFHWYDPYWFTHQGADWGLQSWVFLRKVPYPSTPENIRAAMALEGDEAARIWVERYGLERWDATRIGAEVAAMAEWAQRRGVPLYCGEFGALKDYSEPQARYTWLSDVRTALESKHIGWAMWDYETGFGVVTKGSSGTVVDEGVARALGLKK